MNYTETIGNEDVAECSVLFGELGALSVILALLCWFVTNVLDQKNLTVFQ